MTHRALKRFDKHLTRVVWACFAVWLFALIHPTPAMLQAVIMLIITAVVYFSIGVSVAGIIICKYEQKEEK
jgi:uncharacterized protein YhhL (DUF1145 family)